jgi:hypothetical protein
MLPRLSGGCVNLTIVTAGYRGARVYESIGSAVGAFSNAAASGQVSIEADAAADALTRMGKVKNELQDLLRSGGEGTTSVQLGGNPVGQAMSQKSMGRYDGADSFMVAVQQLLDQTDKAERALKQCIDNYVDTDTGHAGKYNRT